MPRANLRKTAAEQAHAEYDPQIHGVRRETRSQVRSIRSAGPALEDSLQRSAQQLRHAGLSPRDQAIALRELASRTADVGASTALQTQQVQQEGHGQIVDLLEGRGQAQRASLSQLQAAAAEHAQDIRDEEAGETRDFKMDILKEEALKRLGLGSYADDGDAGGLTPTQERAADKAHHDAAFYAKQLFQGAKGGVTDEKTGKVVVPPGPQNWDDSIWNALVEKVDDKVGDVAVAQRAVQSIRDHVQPGSDATSGSLLKALGTVASVAVPALAPKPLAPIAQFGAGLLRPRR